eukprot:scaffold63499_cov63-Phaeocystis_antarctica.AAC.8
MPAAQWLVPGRNCSQEPAEPAPRGQGGELWRHQDGACSMLLCSSRVPVPNTTMPLYQDSTPSPAAGRAPCSTIETRASSRQLSAPARSAPLTATPCACSSVPDVTSSPSTSSEVLGMVRRPRGFAALPAPGGSPCSSTVTPAARVAASPAEAGTVPPVHAAGSCHGMSCAAS